MLENKKQRHENNQQCGNCVGKGAAVCTIWLKLKLTGEQLLEGRNVK